MTRGKVPWEVLEHTADTGIVVRAGSLPELFERAAAAMFDAMVDLDTVEPRGEAEEVSVLAPDRETLLVAWLSELLSRAEAEGRLYGEFDVRELGGSGDGWRLVARVRGEPVDPSRHAFALEIKAVTYHLLEVREEAPGRWVARVLFDI